jgi:hypothetical protein
MVILAKESAELVCAMEVLLDYSNFRIVSDNPRYPCLNCKIKEDLKFIFQNQNVFAVVPSAC